MGKKNCCEYCNKEIDDPSWEEGTLIIEYPHLDYTAMKKKLCGECAINAFEDRVDGIFFDHCEECGKEFDVVDEYCQYENRVEDSIFSNWEHFGKILCACCAYEKWDAEMESQEREFGICPDKEDYNSDAESYTAYDAALAWISHGMDEDYMFGYSEDELRDALK